MAQTIIDSLLIELSLDSSKFEEGQKKSVEALRKFDAESQKSSKTFQENNKKSSEGLISTKDALLGLSTAFAGLSIVKAFSVDMINANAQLGRTSELLGQSPQQITAWGTVLKGVGGTVDDFTSSIQGVESSVARLKMGMGGTEILRPMGMLGLNMQNVADPMAEASALKKAVKQYGEQEALLLAQGLGINAKTFQAMISPDLKSQYKTGLEQANVDSAATKKSEQQQKALSEFGATIDGIKQKLKSELDPAIDFTIKEMTNLAKGFSGLNSNTQAAIIGFGGLIAILGTIKTIGGVLGLLGGGAAATTAAAGGVAATEVAAVAAAAAGTGAVAGAASGGVAATVAGLSAAFGSLMLAGAGGFGAGSIINSGINKYGFKGRNSFGGYLSDHFDPNNHNLELGKPNGTLGKKQAKLRALESLRGLPTGSLDALWAIESARGKNKGSSSAGAIGDFQFMPDAAKRFGVTDRNSFDQESVAASKYMKALIAMFHDPAVAAGAYNWGEGNMKAFLKTGKGAFGQSMPSETKNYMKDYNAYMGAGIGASLKGGHAPSTTEVNIQTIQVNAPNATDASGISQSIHGALQKNLLLTQSAIGSN
jgi:hypothetical protein